MTNKEALFAKLQNPVSDASIEVALIDRGVSPCVEYDTDQTLGVEMALVDLLYSLYTKPDISEGGFSESHPDYLRKIKERLLQLAVKYKLTDILDQLQDVVPTITSKSIW